MDLGVACHPPALLCPVSPPIFPRRWTAFPTCSRPCPQSVPLVIGQFLEMIDENTAIVGSTTGSNYYVRILSTLDREQLKPSASMALHR